MVMVSQMPLITMTIMMEFQITLITMMTTTVSQTTKKTKTVMVFSISLTMMMIMMVFQMIKKTKTLMVMALLMLLVSTIIIKNIIKLILIYFKGHLIRRKRQSGNYLNVTLDVKSNVNNTTQSITQSITMTIDYYIKSIRSYDSYHLVFEQLLLYLNISKPVLDTYYTCTIYVKWIRYSRCHIKFAVFEIVCALTR